MKIIAKEIDLDADMFEKDIKRKIKYKGLQEFLIVEADDKPDKIIITIKQK